MEDLPKPGGTPSAAGTLAAAIEAQPICIGSTVRSAGELGDALVYHAAERPDGRVEVGYYVFFSDERPWGNNWQSWSVLPALAIDLVYTRGFLVAPGVQRMKYGKADVEGFRVVYRRETGGRLTVERVFADDDGHQPTELRVENLLIDGRGDGDAPPAVTLSTNTWTHHLAGRAVNVDELVYRRCYRGVAVRPLDATINAEFRLEERAWPAMLAGQAGYSGHS